MKTTTLNPVSHALKMALAVLVLLTGVANAETASLINSEVAVSADKNSQIARVETLSTSGLRLLKTDEAIPLAREDVVHLNRMASTQMANTVEDAQIRISSRATSTSMQSFLARTSMNQLQTVFREASNMIDARHVSPPAYRIRSQSALQGVALALNNPEFLRANNVNANPQTIQSVQAQLQQLAQTQPAEDVTQALGLMQITAETVNRGLGIRREAIALEFLNGTLDSLDKYSAFMPEMGNGAGAMIDAFQTAALEENIVGVGVELKTHAQGAEIVGVIEGGPAAGLGIQEGDILLAVGQVSMAGKTLNEVANSLAGNAGSSVTVDVLRGTQKFRGTMVRRSFYVSSVSGTKMLDASTGTGYIRLKQFSESSATDLEKALFSLHNQGMKNLVFDLRGNPGGLLDVCVVISDMFLTQGVIVSTQGRNPGDNTKETATFPKTWAVPLVVLVDENSASASEIFAAAIQENNRGIVVGRTSYGKGTVQTHFPMQSVSAVLKLTTANFYSPTGRKMAGSGVTPDVLINTQTTAYRGTDNDADVTAARGLITQGAPAQVLAGTLNRSQLGAPVNNVPTYAPVNNGNFPIGYPSVPNMNPGYNLTGTPNVNQAGNSTIPHTTNYPTAPLNNVFPNYNVQNGNGFQNNYAPNYSVPSYNVPNYNVPNYNNLNSANQNFNNMAAPQYNQGNNNLRGI